MTRKHQRGEPIRLDAEIQNKVEALALDNVFGSRSLDGALPFFGLTIRVKNVASSDHFARRQLVQLGPYVVDPDDATQGASDPTLEADSPTWPDVFGTFGVTVQPIPNGKFGRVLVLGIGQATVNVVSTDDRFAAPDYSDPTRLRSSDTGEVKLIGEPAATGSRTMLVAVGFQPSVTWHYERTADYPTNTVKLLGLDDTAFSGTSTVTMLDTRTLMDDQESGDKGIMTQIGSQFVAVNAIC